MRMRSAVSCCASINYVRSCKIVVSFGLINCESRSSAETPGRSTPDSTNGWVRRRMDENGFIMIYSFFCRFLSVLMCDRG